MLRSRLESPPGAAYILFISNADTHKRAQKITKFETGTTYQTRSIGDSGCIFSYTVIRRTAKTITINSAIRGERRCRITVMDGIETIFPEGRYSMCPVIDATKKAA